MFKKVLLVVLILGELAALIMGIVAHIEALYWMGAALFIIDEVSQGFLFPGGERGALIIESATAGVYLALAVVGFLFGGLPWWAWLALGGYKLINVRRHGQAGRHGEFFRLRRHPLREALLLVVGFVLIYIGSLPH